MAEKSNRPSMNWEAMDLPKEWARFRQHCEFTFKGPLASKTEVEKVNYLMTYIGDKGRELYTTFTFAPAMQDDPAESDTLAGVYNKYAEYVVPKTAQIKAAVKFQRRKQGTKEGFDEFVTDLRLLVKDCGYTDEDRMLRDAIVMNAHSTIVQEKCLEKGDDLTLDMVIRIGQSHEMSQDSLKVISQKIDEDVKVNAVHKRRWNNQKHHRGATAQTCSATSRPQKADNQGTCGKCGNSRNHARCPAADSICSKCKMKGHWANTCRNGYRKDAKSTKFRAAHMVQEASDDEDYSDMHLVAAIHTNDHPTEDDWWETVEIQDQDVRCQIDTGAAHSLIPYSTFVKMSCTGKLKPTGLKFQSYTKHPIKVEG